MKIGEKLHGFLVDGAASISEIDAVLYSLRHEKHGTPLIYLDRDDTNKSFYIAFRTLPSDDTGVFHIIEHSVLSGSRKFPVKEPFVEMLKSSLKTFLNAMTYSDRTVYPVSSRCDKDFYNLVDVYMDAVFHPLMLENEFIFMQEGHRLELYDKDEPLTESGVVFSEMKGAMSSADELMDEELTKLLYRGTIYSKNSGGDPDAIPSLTYEDFTEAHRKYYHPKEAHIFLDGKVDLDSVLPLIDGYLSEFEPEERKVEAAYDAPVSYAEATVPYELGEDEDTVDRTRVALGFRAYGFRDVAKMFMLSVLTDAIAGSNEAPLKKALLDSGLCEDMSLYPLLDEVYENSYALELKNVKDGQADEALALVEKELTRLVCEGIGRERLEASLNLREFRLCEKDFGDTPRGLVFGLAIVDQWLYGGNPTDCIEGAPVINAARAALNTDGYERMLEEIFLKNEKRVRVTLLPDNTLGRKRAEREALALDEKKRAMTDRELQSLIEKTTAFREWQETPNDPEKLDTLPTLSLSDIPKDFEWAPTEAANEGGALTLSHEMKTGGITYAEMYFDVSDLAPEELSYLTLLSALLGKSDTENYTAEKLIEIRKTKLGSFYATPTSLKGDRAVPYLKVIASALDKNRDALTELLSEILNRTVFTDVAKIKKALRQMLIVAKESFTSSGHTVALSRARAYVSDGGAIMEHFFGIEVYRRMNEAERIIEKSPEVIVQRLSSLLKRVIERRRLTVGVTAENAGSFAASIASVPEREGKTPTPHPTEPLGIKNEGFAVPSRVSFAAMAADYRRDGRPHSGSMHVVSNIVTYTHLWETIRVRGGAYGAGLSIRASGLAAAYSYRDPNPAASLRAMADSWQALRALAEDPEPIDSFIIGTFGDYDSLSTPRSLGADATAFYLVGRTREVEERHRREMLETSKEQLIRHSHELEEAFAERGVCVLGPRESLLECGELLSEIIEL